MVQDIFIWEVRESCGGTYISLDNTHKVVCPTEALEGRAVNYREMLDPVTEWYSEVQINQSGSSETIFGNIKCSMNLNFLDRLIHSVDP